MDLLNTLHTTWNCCHLQHHNPQITAAAAEPFPAYVFTSHSLATASNSGVFSPSRFQILFLQPPVQN
jgi:hypothetical protein